MCGQPQHASQGAMRYLHFSKHQRCCLPEPVLGFDCLQKASKKSLIDQEILMVLSPLCFEQHPLCLACTLHLLMRHSAQREKGTHPPSDLIFMLLADELSWNQTSYMLTSANREQAKALPGCKELLTATAIRDTASALLSSCYHKS